MRWLRASALRGLCVAVCVLALSAGACNSPTLPLPPPGVTAMSVSADHASLTISGSGAIPGAYVFIVNDDLGEGRITSAGRRGDYRMVLPLDLSLHDQNWFTIWQRYGIEDSSSDSFPGPLPYGPGSVGWEGGAPDAGRGSDA